MLEAILKIIAKRIFGEQLGQVILANFIAHAQQHTAIAQQPSASPQQEQQLIPFPNQQVVLQKTMFENYICKKCQHNKYHTGEIREVSGLVSKIFNLQTRRFKTVSCDQCGYTEYFERAQSALANVTDLIVR